MQPFPAVSSGNRALEEASAFKAIKDSQPSKLYFAECQQLKIIWLLHPTCSLMPVIGTSQLLQRSFG